MLAFAAVAVFAPIAGAQPRIVGLPEVSAGDVDFGSVLLDGSQSLRTVTMTAAGEPGTSVKVYKAETSLSSEFTVATDGCTQVSVSVGHSCEMQLAFKPYTTGLRAGLFTFDTSGGTKKVNLTGTGVPTVEPDRHVDLSVGQSRRAKRVGKRIITVINATFPVPEHLDPQTACFGNATIVLKFAGVRTIHGRTGVLWGPEGCRANFVLRLLARLRRKKASVLARFAGNTGLLPARRTVKLRIKQPIGRARLCRV